MLKSCFTVLLAALGLSLAAQHPCSVSKAHSHQNNIAKQAKTASTSAIPPENDYDVKFYHLDLAIENNSLFVKGNVRCLAQVTAATMDTFVCVLHENHTVDSVYVNGQRRNFVRKDSLVKTSVGPQLGQNQMVNAVVYYKGTCPSGGSAAIGNGFNTDTSPSWGNSVTWSLSESFVAYEWFPCKQDLRDKIDSSWVYVTTDSVNMAGSNGRLKNVVVLGNKKRYEWKSRSPIDYYLISVSVARYKEYNLYAKPLYLVNDSILIQNYIYNNAISNTNWINGQKQELDKIKPTIELFSKLYGMYPFYKEKYGHCMAPLGGGMEHQTMTTLGFFDFAIDAHELAHQWWGDNVTCSAWKHIWMNEGWASYNEYIAKQYLVSPNQADIDMAQVHTDVLSQPGGSVYFTNADTMNSGRIFDSRLTYNKGGAIIHSLRFVLNNDSLFFNLARDFQRANQFGVAGVPDFIAYYNTHSGQNLNQFFSQWYYGEGYPTFNVKWNQQGSTFLLRSAQTTSMPSSVPLFITPIEYKLVRSGAADTTIRVMHGQATENYTVNVAGTVTNIVVDPKNWILNKTIGPVKDPTLVGVEEMTADDLMLFVGPNPTSDVLYINTYTQENFTAELYDISGKLLRQWPVQGTSHTDLGSYPAGIYQVRILSKAGQPLKTVKVVRQ